jgi:hypothetical protein
MRFHGSAYRRGWAGVLLVAACGIGACESKPEQALLPGDDVILAEAEGMVVTQYDLDAYIEATLGDFAAARIDDEGRKKALEGLVATKVIAAAREKELSDIQRTELDKKGQAYREQLLVKQYVSFHAPPEPVTAEQIQSYYEQNKDRFGARTERSFEMLFSTRTLSDSEQRSMLDALAKSKAVANSAEEDWAKLAATLRADGLPIHHRRGVAGRTPLPPKLEQTLRTMKVGKASAPIFVQGKAFVLRVTGEKQFPPRTLKEVSGEIRERLAPLQVKKAIAKIRAEAMRDVTVGYR